MAVKFYKKNISWDRYDAIVIGSGIGGLTTAALLSKSGKKVLVLERHYVAGGFTHVFRRKKYEWDVGVHYIGKVHKQNSMLRTLFDYLSDGELQWAEMDQTYDRAYFGDRHYDFVAGKENFRETMQQYFPDEKAAIDTYLEEISKANKASQAFFAQKAMPQIFDPLTYPWMAKKALHYSDMTTLEALRKITKNPELIGVLTTQWGDYGLPPGQSSFLIHALVARHYLDGASYPVGGSQKISDTIIPVIEKAGGEVVAKAEVAKVIVDNGKAVGVELATGEQIHAEHVISSIGALNTYENLLDEKLVQQHKLDQKMHLVDRSFGHLCLYIGLQQTAEQLNFPKTNYWIYPGYDHDANIRNYLSNQSLDFPLVYISFPSAKDPSWTQHHGNTATIEMITFASYFWFQQWEDTQWKKRGDQYEDYKEQLSQKLLQTLYKYVPQTQGKIDQYELSTPLSTKHFCNYKYGEIYGLDHTPQRFRQKWLRPKTPIGNLFLTGQDIVTDGVGGALFGGVLTASTILGKNLVKSIMKQKKL